MMGGALWPCHPHESLETRLVTARNIVAAGEIPKHYLTERGILFSRKEKSFNAPQPLRVLEPEGVALSERQKGGTHS